MSYSVPATEGGLFFRAVQAAQAEGILSEVPRAGLGFVNLRFAAARLVWVEALRQVLESALCLLGGSAPQEKKRAENTDESEGS